MTIGEGAVAHAAMLQPAAAGGAAAKASGPARSLRHKRTFREHKASLSGRLPMSQTLHMPGERFRASNYAVCFSRSVALTELLR
jgi:hypothetical protein